MVVSPRFQESQRRFWILRLDTEVRDDGLYVQFWPLHRSFRRIPFEDIEDVTVTTYSAREFGGWAWGIRIGPSMDSVAYRVRGNDGVRVERRNGTDLFLGSQSPTELADAVRTAKEYEYDRE
jgi:hypothetical protein